LQLRIRRNQPEAARIGYCLAHQFPLRVTRWCDRYGNVLRRQVNRIPEQNELQSRDQQNQPDAGPVGQQA